MSITNCYATVMYITEVKRADSLWPACPCSSLDRMTICVRS